MEKSSNFPNFFFEKITKIGVISAMGLKQIERSGNSKIEVRKIWVRLWAFLKANQRDWKKSSNIRKVRKVRCSKNRGADLVLSNAPSLFGWSFTVST